MTTLSQKFITKSAEATSFDYDTNQFPDPHKAEELFEWLENNASIFETPETSSLHIISRFSNATFHDGSTLTIRANYLNDEIKLVDGTGFSPVKNPASLYIKRNSRGAYTYFRLMALRQQRDSTPNIHS